MVRHQWALQLRAMALHRWVLQLQDMVLRRWAHRLQDMALPLMELHQALRLTVHLRPELPSTALQVQMLQDMALLNLSIQEHRTQACNNKCTTKTPVPSRLLLRIT